MPDSNVTKKALAASLKALMKKEPFSKISISQICQGCGMNRKSFYYHFRDKYDLVNWIFYTEFLLSIRLTDYQKSWDFMKDICAYFYDERDFYKKAFLIEGQNSFQEFFSETIKPFLEQFSENIFQDSEHFHKEDQSFYVTFFSDAFLCSIIRWLTNETQKLPQKYLEQLRRAALGFAMSVIKNPPQDE